MKLIKQLEKEINSFENEGAKEPIGITLGEGLLVRRKVLEQTKEICEMIEEEGKKFAETKVTEYSEGYSNGWIACVNLILSKIKGDD